MFFLGKTAVGLEAEDGGLTLVKLQQSSRGAKIISANHLPLATGVIEHGLIKDREKLIKALIELLSGGKAKQSKAEHIIFGLPHEQCYQTIAPLPESIDDGLLGSIEQIAYANLPIEADDLMLEYKILETVDQKKQVLLIGASLKYLQSWQAVLVAAGLTVDMFDIGAYALERDLLIANQTDDTAIVDLGAVKSHLFIFNQGHLAYGYDIDSGGNYLTKIIADKFKLTVEVAETKKINLGLNRQLFPILDQTLTSLAEELSRALDDYQVKTGRPVAEVKLVGGGAKLKGLVAYCREALGLPVALGQLGSLPNGTDCQLTEACGLALRALFPDKYQDQPWLSLATEHVSLLTEEKVAVSLPQEAIDRNEAIIDDEPTGEAVDSEKFTKEKKLLAIILIIGAVAVVGAYWYRTSERAKQLQAQGAPIVVLAETQSFPYKIAISLNQAATPGLAGGRIINDKINKAGDYNEALNLSRRKISGQLAANEDSWPEPLNEVIDKTKITAPFSFSWLAFNKQEVLKLAMAEVDKLNIDKVAYEFNGIDKIKIEKTDSLDKVYLSGDITVSVAKKINTPQTVDLSSMSTSSVSTATTSSPVAGPLSATSSAVTVGNRATETVAVDTRQVLIGATETGWLNVRQGPGKTFAVLIKIYPGESYDYVGQNIDWWQIKLKDGRTGWILAKYGKLN